MGGRLFKTVRREKIRAIDLHDLDIKNGSAGLVDERSFGEDEDLCIRFTYQRLPRLSKIRTGERMGEVNNPRNQLFGWPCDRAENYPMVTIFKEELIASRKQRRAARKNIKKAVKAAKRKQTLKHLPKRTRRALGKQAAKVRNSQR
jgi:hypothetical protein